MSRPYAVWVAMLLAGCAPVAHQVPKPLTTEVPRPAAVAVPAGLVAEQVRLFQVSYPLLRAARDWCTDSATHGLGLFALNRHTMGAYSNLAWRYAIGDEMRVLAAVPDGPAYRAGLNAGDLIVAINGEPTPTTAAATRAFSLRMAQLARSGGPVRIAATRDAVPFTVTVHPEHLCGYHLEIAEVPQVNARTDGRRSIQITRGMLRFAHTESELALVVAHEIAHNALGHVDARSRVMRSLAAAAPAARTVNGMPAAFSQALEMEADRMALYIMARAGMPLHGTPGFIERLGRVAGTGPDAQTHPASSARVAALARTVQEIDRKRAAGAPLAP